MYELLDLAIKIIFAELQRGFAAFFCAVWWSVFGGLNDGLGGGFFKENAGCAILDDVQCAARFSGDDGQAAGEGFCGHDAEVFNLGEQQGLGSAIHVHDGCIIDATEELNGWARRGLEG